MTDLTRAAIVVCVAPDLIQIEVFDPQTYQQADANIEIGSYLKISDDNGLAVIAIVRSYKIKDSIGDEAGTVPQKLGFIIDAQPVGRLCDGKFTRGGKQITIPPTRIEIATVDVLSDIYGNVPPGKEFSFGVIAQSESVRVSVDGDRFFGKHIGVVGSTGSGKSCTVAKILQEGTRSSSAQASAGILNNSHVIIFDLHGEYPSAFPKANVIDTDSLRLPYWLMNAEELEEMFIESNEQNSHNQISQFRQAVIENKKLHAVSPSGGLSYDSPVYFSLREVINYLTNLNSEVIGKNPSENKPKLADGTLIEDRERSYFTDVLQFVEQSTAGGRKASNGPFYGEFGRFLLRLEARLNDRRLDFLLSPTKESGEEYHTDDLADLLRQFTGYGPVRSNVTIVDMSGIPFEVLSVVVSLITRLIFTLSFHFKRVGRISERDLPFLLVYEEAHNYIPQDSGSRYGSVRKAIERIAKEGRKYGISLMIVSQRPSEISETVFSQCNNFVAMRLTNPTDQRYVKKLLPDTVSGITDALPSLEGREAIVIGDSISIPTVVRVDEVEQRPDSHDIAFHTEWKLDWLDFHFHELLKSWQS